MTVTSIDIYDVALTSHVTYNMADGKTCDTVKSVVLEIKTSDGLTGWGEVCPIPHYLPAYADGVMPAVIEMAPVLLGANALDCDAVMARLDAHLQGHVYAKSAVSMALWDIMGKAAQLPLVRLLGGQVQADMPLYHSITCVDPDAMAGMAKTAYATGIRQFQVKLGADQNNEADIARLRLVREAVGAGPLVYGDWNCGATPLNATRVGRAVMDLDIMLEQPCATLEECASVKKATGLPMKIDESAHDTASLLKAYELGCLDAVALKTSKFGGIGPMRKARDLCIHLGAMMCIEDTWGSDITTAAALHLGASTPASHVLNVCDLSSYVGPRIDAAAPERLKGRITRPEGFGLGVNPDRAVLGKPVHTIE